MSDDGHDYDERTEGDEVDASRVSRLETNEPGPVESDLSDQPREDANREATEHTRQFLTFHLSDELYGVEVGQVREVLEYPAITPVPRTREWLLGVINLRGSVVPVIDLKMMFDMGSTEVTEETCVIVIEVLLEGELAILGALTDSVDEVIDLADGQIERSPGYGTRLRNDVVKAMGSHGDRFVILLDMQELFGREQLDVVKPMRNGDRSRGKRAAMSPRDTAEHEHTEHAATTPGRSLILDEDESSVESADLGPAAAADSASDTNR